MKKILFITATHGDEGFSVDIMRQVSKQYSKKVFGYDWIIGNPKAYARGVRCIDTDLNRSAPGLSKSLDYETRRAKEIIKLSREYEYVIDIHGTTSNLGIATIVTNPTIQNLCFACILPIGKRVIWYSKKSLLSGPLTQFITSPAIELECGPKDSPKIRRELTKAIGSILKNIRDTKLEKVFSRLEADRDFYVVYGTLKETLSGLYDFKRTKVCGEIFYPFLSYQYNNVDCYKMRKVSIKNCFIY